MSENIGVLGRIGLAQPRGTRQLLRQKLVRGLGRLRARMLFADCVRGAGLCATGRVRVDVHDNATIGSHVTFLGGMIPSELTVARGGQLAIGDDSIFNYGVSIAAQGSITIGRRCMFGSFVRIAARGRLPVVLGDDVWVAHGAIIEPGVTIGDGSVVSAGSVVCSNIPAHSLAIGNPARAMSLELAIGR